jgi:superfamily II DNA/RNA helicase
MCYILHCVAYCSQLERHLLVSNYLVNAALTGRYCYGQTHFNYSSLALIDNYKSNATSATYIVRNYINAASMHVLILLALTNTVAHVVYTLHGQLQQGIDVPECNLVISLDPLKHVRHMMHTRGRTRARGGKFCVLVQEHSGEQEKVVFVTVTIVTVTIVTV